MTRFCLQVGKVFFGVVLKQGKRIKFVIVASNSLNPKRF